MKITENELLQEVMQQLAIDVTVPLDPEKHVTYEMLEQQSGYKVGWLRNRMEQLVQQGLYKKVSVILPNGKRGVAFTKGSAK